MALWDFIKGQFIDVIEWTDDTRDTIVWRFERHGNEIKYGAKLTVREGQVAVFVHEGQIADVFPPGLYMLETNNMPIMTSLQHWDHGFNSPFKSEIYFVSTVRFQDLKWGTKNPIMLRDPEFGPIRLRAFGTYSIRVKDAATFLREIVGTDGEVTTDEVTDNLRNIIVSRFSARIAGAGIPVLDMAANTDQLSEILRERIAPEMEEYGLEMPKLLIENISLPREVEEALDKRTSIGVIGDLSKYTRFSAAEAMTKAAETPGSNMGAGLGIGMSMAMANQMAKAMNQPAEQAPAAAPAAPPPPPKQTVWHVAEAGQTRGPFDLNTLSQMAASGAFTRDTLVWAQGYAGWTKAGEVAELAQIFGAMPPPPPPPAG
ncbi:MAG: SPFH domain-containing protein [Alphaproteobacteria bacterium]|nr:MAG: SPFH domain-containing protein [Alphaproteobacteria bacterium]